MAILGCHMSIAGGFYRAVERAAEAGCDCVQIFTTPPRMWPKPQVGRRGAEANSIGPDAASEFQDALERCEIAAPVAHASYLINLASPDGVLWKKSIDACVVELTRANRLGIDYVVLHPGAFTTSSEAAGLIRISQALDEIHGQLGPMGTSCLLETTAGQGSTLGHRFEHLAEIIEHTNDPDRLGVCFDTCHVFAAGYDIGTRSAYLKTMRQLNQSVGIAQVRAFHLNDSKAPLGSRRDRHEHIGKGCLGLDPFRHLLNDRRFRRIPMYLETPKGDRGSRPWDKVNLATLRGLISK